ncbi:hypothetical protein BBP40_000708 [Aspergillus hancockii]|nr:hypothetical protein BBP40_000708 [Aspergillus hancockii]
MSALLGGEIQPPALSEFQTRNDHVPDLVQFFQAQDSLSTGSPQSNGAREIFKAGQRRLRQLTQRPKKGTDPQAKAEAASRQLLALQQEGFLPTPLSTSSKPKKSTPKRSIDSSVSSAASNLSFRTSSRRDVESIGQPWLGGTLEKLNTCETIGSRLSSLDLRDLASSVKASVPQPQLEDATPPHYQPSTESNTPSRDGHSLQEHCSGPVSLHDLVSEQSDKIEALPKFPSIPDRTSSNHSKISVSAPPSDNKQQTSHKQSKATKTAEPKDAPNGADDKSSFAWIKCNQRSLPMPAPMRPLPALPEPVPGIRPTHGQGAPAGRRVSSANQKQQGLEIQPRSPEEGPKGSSARGNTSTAGRTASDSRVDEATEQGAEITRTDASSPTELIQSVKASQSRAERSNYYSHETRGGRHHSSYVMELEKRIAHLEHQNKTLQAALLAALDVGAKHNVEGLLGGSATSLSTPPTGRSFSSGTNSSFSPDYHNTRKKRETRRRQPPYRPETWIASPGSSNYGSEASADIRELEDMIEDFDFGWESDQSSPERTQQPRIRA